MSDMQFRAVRKRADKSEKRESDCFRISCSFEASAFTD